MSNITKLVKNMNTEKTFEIYKITNLVNNKIYIGGTTDGAGFRFKRHIIKAKSGSEYPFHKALIEFGESNFKVEVLEFCKDLIEMNSRETYWINFLKSSDPNIGYNVRPGGGVRFQSEETRIKIGNIHRGKISEKRIPVLQYTSDGSFIKEYSSVTEAANLNKMERSQIIRVLKGKMCRPTAKNPYIWIYKNGEIESTVDPKNYYKNLDYKPTVSESFKKVRDSVDRKGKDLAIMAKPVEQYDLDGNFIAVYRSLGEAYKATGVSAPTIRKQLQDPDYIKNLKTKHKTKFIWKAADPNDESLKITNEELQERANNKNRVTITKYDEFANIVTVYNSVEEFTKSEKKDIRTIRKYAMWNEPYDGFYWEII